MSDTIDFQEECYYRQRIFCYDKMVRRVRRYKKHSVVAFKKEVPQHMKQNGQKCMKRGKRKNSHKHNYNWIFQYSSLIN